MNAQFILERFNSRIEQEKNDGLNSNLVINYSNHTAFTGEILNLIEKIVQEDGYNIKKRKDNKLLGEGKWVQREYYRIDLIGYTARRNEEKKKNGFEHELWNFDFAIEHENNNKKWCDEAIKLAYICCPLRIIISYLPANERTNSEIGDKFYLEIVADMFDKLPEMACHNLRQGEYIIVLGNSKTKEPASYFDYKAYRLKYDCNKSNFCFETIN